MGNGYPQPKGDEFGEFAAAIRNILARLRELETMRGSQIYESVKELRSLVENLEQAIEDLSSSGATWYGPVSSGSGNITTTSGDFYTPHGRATPVVTSYVSAYLNSDGRIGATPSTRRLKRDIRAATWTREQRDMIRVVYYRLRAAFILADMQGDSYAAETQVGLIGEELLEAGMPEFVVLDDRGRVFSVRYELIGLVAVDGLQQVEREVDALREELAELRSLVAAGRKPGS